MADAELAALDRVLHRLVSTPDARLAPVLATAGILGGKTKASKPMKKVTIASPPSLPSAAEGRREGFRTSVGATGEPSPPRALELERRAQSPSRPRARPPRSI